MTRPPPSPAGAAEDLAPGADVLEAAAVLAERSLYGLIWLSPDLRVAAHYGGLAQFVEAGREISDIIYPLYGLEARIVALQRTPQRLFEVPNCAFETDAGTTPRLNIHVMWIGRRRQYLMMLSRVFERSDIEIELSREVRHRLMIEAELAQKSSELAASNLELSRANRDLEEFASIISHDLKAPMRAVRYMTEEIERSVAGAGPGEELKDALDRMRGQVRRMQGMLSGLLNYSSIGRKEEALEVIDTRALAGDVVASLPRPGAFSIAIEGDWPRARTLSVPLDLVLRNLVENALKHHDRAAGTIELRCRVERAEAGQAALEIEVHDDGPGIAQRYHEAIFQPFRKLERGAAEGQGLGLALVRKTVEVAGGRISVASPAPHGRGTTFKLTWPAEIVAE